MKHLKLKIVLSVVVILIGIIVIRLISVDNKAEADGLIFLTIENENKDVVFSGELEFYTGDSFFDILNREFDLTCGTATYLPDEDCSHSFKGFEYQGKVILGIKGDDFDLMTDWKNTFLSFYHYNNQERVLATSGPSNIPFKDQDSFLICLEEAWGS